MFIKSIISIILSLILISSCAEIRLSQPHPLNVRELDEFPSLLTGQYVTSSGDTLEVKPNSFRFFTDNVMTLESDNMVLKMKGTMYYLSCKEYNYYDIKINRKGWTVLPFNMSNDSLVVYFLNITNKEVGTQTIEKLEDIIEVKNIYNDEGKVEYYYIEPDEQQFEKMMSSGCFSVAEKFVRIK